MHFKSHKSKKARKAIQAINKNEKEWSNKRNQLLGPLNCSTKIKNWVNRGSSSN